MVDLRSLDIRHLAAIDAVASAGTFAGAAQQLGYTQSAVSQQIAALEQMVGAPLFDRPGGPRPARLTSLGELLAERAHELLVRVDAIGEEIERVRDGRAGTLGIGTFQSVSAVVLPPVLSRLNDRFPHLRYRIVNADNDASLLASLESGEADIAFVGADAPNVAVEPVLADPWVLVAPLGRFSNGPVTVTELIDEPLVGQQLDTWQRQCETELRVLGVEPNVVFRSNENTTMAAMVRAGIGVAVLPLLAVDAAGLSLHRLEPPLSDRQILLARRTDRTIPASVDAFVEIVHRVCAELSQRMTQQLGV